MCITAVLACSDGDSGKGRSFDFSGKAADDYVEDSLDYPKSTKGA